MESDMCRFEIIRKQCLVSDYEIKRDEVRNELIGRALNPVNFERSCDIVSGKIL